MDFDDGEKRFLNRLTLLLALGGLFLVGIFILTIIVTGDPDATNLENALVQFIAFAFSVAISIGIGYLSAKEQGKAIVRPHGRKAVRRIVTLGYGVRSFGATIEKERELVQHRADVSGQISVSEVEKTFDLLYIQLEGQLRTVGDAIEDWRDVVPEEVATIEKRGERTGQDERAD